MPAVVAMRSTPRSAQLVPSASSCSVARRTSAWTAAGLANPLLDLTSQGDVATITDESKLPDVKLMNPQQLYELWERQQWQSQTIDFTQDREDWARLSPEDKANLSWNLSSFFVGEER